tara:strand:+ start:1250 stop:1969 length:720 start_codon:yes stop_codon:yes gene_type:complete
MTLKNDMTFIQHLEAFRWALIRIFVIISISMFFSFMYSDLIQDFMMKPINNLHLTNFKLQDIKITSPFMVKIVVALFTSLIVSFPYFMFEILKFIYPAIPKISKIYLSIIYIFSIIFFILGCIFGYRYLFPSTISFFINLVDPNIEFNPERLNYIFYSFWLIVISGLIYQLPIISLILTKLKIINYEFLKQMRSIAFVVFLVFGAVVSPPDPLSQLLIAFPLYVLYELGIIVSYVFRTR